MGHLALTGNTGAPNIALYWTTCNAIKRDQMSIFNSHFARGVHTSYSESCT